MYTLPDSPLTLASVNAPEEGATGSLLAMIRDLQGRPPAPLVRSGSLQELAAMLSGLAAGVRGQKNPVIEQLLQQRGQEQEQQRFSIANAAAVGTLGLGIKREERAEREYKEDRARKALEFGFQVSKENITRGREMGDISMIERGLRQQRELGLLGDAAQFPDEKLRQAAENIINLGDLDTRRKTIGALYLSGREVPPALRIPAFDELNRTPAGRLQLRKMLGLEDEEKHLAEQEKLEAEKGLLKAKFASHAKIKAGGVPDINDMLNLGIKPEDAGFFYSLAKAEGKPLSQAQRGIVASYARELGLKGLSGNARLALLTLEASDPAERAKFQAAFEKLTDAEKKSAIVTMAHEVARVKAKPDAQRTPDELIKLQAWEEIKGLTAEQLMAKDPYDYIIWQALKGGKYSPFKFSPTPRPARPGATIPETDPAVQQARKYGSAEKALQALQDAKLAPEQKAKYFQAIIQVYGMSE